MFARPYTYRVTGYMELSFRLVKLVLSCSLQRGSEVHVISQSNTNADDKNVKNVKKIEREGSVH